VKRLLKLLSMLYPPAWRNRYGTEFEVLLEDTPPRTRDAFNILWEAIKMQMTRRSFVKIVLPCSIAGALVAAAISFTVPPLYVSQMAFLTGETHGASTAGTTDVTEGEEEQILSNMRDIILDRNFLASTIHKYDLYPRERAYMPLDKVIDKMLRNIEVKRGPVTQPGVPGSRSGFIVDYAYSDQARAKLIRDVLVGRYLRAHHFQPHEYFAVGFLPAIPQKLYRRNRLQETAVGLLAGLLSGIVLATIFSSRYHPTATNT
jgi:uncharacterized protein involved in exopolysaccharide biosynthesis